MCLRATTCAISVALQFYVIDFEVEWLCIVGTMKNEGARHTLWGDPLENTGLSSHEKLNIAVPRGYVCICLFVINVLNILLLWGYKNKYCIEPNLAPKHFWSWTCLLVLGSSV